MRAYARACVCMRVHVCVCVCVCVCVFLAICNRSAACVDVATVTTECVKTNMLECNRTGVRVHIYSFPVPLRGRVSRIQMGTRSSPASIAIEERGILCFELPHSQTCIFMFRHIVCSFGFSFDIQYRFYLLIFR